MEDNIKPMLCSSCNSVLRSINQLGLTINYEDSNNFICTNCGSVFSEDLKLIPGAKLVVD